MAWGKKLVLAGILLAVLFFGSLFAQGQQDKCVSRDSTRMITTQSGNNIDFYLYYEKITPGANGALPKLDKEPIAGGNIIVVINEENVCAGATGADGWMKTSLMQTSASQCMAVRGVFCPYDSPDDLSKCARVEKSKVSGALPPCPSVIGGTADNSLSSKFYPSETETQVCPDPKPASTAFCGLIGLIIGLLLAASMMLGRNPLAMFDLGAARSLRPSRSGGYIPATKNVSVNPVSIATAATAAVDSAAGGTSQKEEAEKPEFESKNGGTTTDTKDAKLDAAGNPIRAKDANGVEMTRKVPVYHKEGGGKTTDASLAKMDGKKPMAVTTPRGIAAYGTGQDMLSKGISSLGDKAGSGVASLLGVGSRGGVALVNTVVKAVVPTAAALGISAATGKKIGWSTVGDAFVLPGAKAITGTLSEIAGSWATKQDAESAKKGANDSEGEKIQAEKTRLEGEIAALRKKMEAAKEKSAEMKGELEGLQKEYAKTKMALEASGEKVKGEMRKEIDAAKGRLEKPGLPQDRKDELQKRIERMEEALAKFSSGNEMGKEDRDAFKGDGVRLSLMENGREKNAHSEAMLKMRALSGVLEARKAEIGNELLALKQMKSEIEMRETALKTLTAPAERLQQAQKKLLELREQYESKREQIGFEVAAEKAAKEPLGGKISSPQAALPSPPNMIDALKNAENDYKTAAEELDNAVNGISSIIPSPPTTVASIGAAISAAGKELSQVELKIERLGHEQNDARTTLEAPEVKQFSAENAPGAATEFGAVSQSAGMRTTGTGGVELNNSDNVRIVPPSSDAALTGGNVTLYVNGQPVVVELGQDYTVPQGIGDSKVLAVSERNGVEITAADGNKVMLELREGALMATQVRDGKETVPYDMPMLNEANGILQAQREYNAAAEQLGQPDADRQKIQEAMSASQIKMQAIMTAAQNNEGLGTANAANAMATLIELKKSELAAVDAKLAQHDKKLADEYGKRAEESAERREEAFAKRGALDMPREQRGEYAANIAGSDPLVAEYVRIRAEKESPEVQHSVGNEKRLFELHEQEQNLERRIAEDGRASATLRIYEYAKNAAAMSDAEAGREHTKLTKEIDMCSDGIANAVSKQDAMSGTVESENARWQYGVQKLMGAVDNIVETALTKRRRGNPANNLGYLSDGQTLALTMPIVSECIYKPFERGFEFGVGGKAAEGMQGAGISAMDTLIQQRLLMQRMQQNRQ